jgi:hypothetical protein
MERLTVVIAAAALIVSLGQWFASLRSERIRLLLGEKETVAFEAIRVAEGKALTGRRTFDALVLASLLESSDRARIVIYRALDHSSQRQRVGIQAFRRELVQAAQQYAGSVDRDSFDKRLGQLDRAVPWITD